MTRRISKLQRIREQQDPALAATRSDYARTLLAEVRRLYEASDYEQGGKRRALLARAAAVHEHLRRVETCAVQ
jgi:hypothetical protein